MTIQQIFQTAERVLVKLTGDIGSALKTENNKVVSAIQAKTLDTSNISAQLNSIKAILANQKPIESVSIDNVEDIAPELKEGLESIVITLKEELSLK